MSEDDELKSKREDMLLDFIENGASRLDAEKMMACIDCVGMIHVSLAECMKKSDKSKTQYHMADVALTAAAKIFQLYAIPSETALQLLNCMLEGTPLEDKVDELMEYFHMAQK